jgi:hypothetical protein
VIVTREMVQQRKGIVSPLVLHSVNKSGRDKLHEERMKVAG